MKTIFISRVVIYDRKLFIIRLATGEFAFLRNWRFAKFSRNCFFFFCESKEFFGKNVKVENEETFLQGFVNNRIET